MDKQIVFYKNPNAVDLIKQHYKCFTLNISGMRYLSPDELRSLRPYEVHLIPYTQMEHWELKNTLLKELNKYGVVAILKNPLEKQLTHKEG